jgi:hypothetical protein
MEALVQYKAKFIELLEATGREGIPDLLDWLETTDFYTAPASTRYHGSYEGGLLEHSVLTCKALRRLIHTFELDISPESADIVALLHDVCKCEFYKLSKRNVKNSDGKWEEVPCYTIEDQFPFGHGEKSVLLLSRYICLSDEEAIAIRWHMGAYDDAAQSYSGSGTLGRALSRYPLAAALHIADMIESHLLNTKQL